MIAVMAVAATGLCLSVAAVGVAVQRANKA
jgi:hypothetical protein